MAAQVRQFMADEPKPEVLPARVASTQPLSTIKKESLRFGSAVPATDELFELRKEELELQSKQVKLNQEVLAGMQKDRKLTHALEIQKLNLYFKMFITAAALAIGTVFVLTNHESVGYFMLGGALSSVTSGVAGLMKASRSQ